MTRLLHDRYVVFDATRGCDLVTGDEVALASIEDDRLISSCQSESSVNAHARGIGQSVPGISEVLGHGRDGEPRWIVVDARNAGQAGAIARRLQKYAVRSYRIEPGCCDFSRPVSRTGRRS